MAIIITINILFFFSSSPRYLPQSAECITVCVLKRVLLLITGSTTFGRVPFTIILQYIRVVNYYDFHDRKPPPPHKLLSVAAWPLKSVLKTVISFSAISHCWIPDVSPIWEKVCSHRITSPSTFFISDKKSNNRIYLIHKTKILFMLWYYLISK